MTNDHKEPEKCGFFVCSREPECTCFIPFDSSLDFVNTPIKTSLVVFMVRFVLCMMFGYKMKHADQNWQGIEIAYNWAYGDKVPIVKSWEWVDEFALRSTLYPFFLSLPLHVLRFLSIDSNFLVVNSIYAMNTLIFVTADYYLYLLTHKLFGNRAAKMALLYQLFNCNINMTFQKTLSNGAEAAFCLCGLYYFSNLKPLFDRNMKLMTLSITFAFIVRSSCIVGWIPLALVKILVPEYTIPIFTAAFCVALPILGACVLMDSLYYGTFACTQINFVKLNVVDNLSASFGTDPWHYYITKLLGMFQNTVEVQRIIFFGFCLAVGLQLNGMTDGESRKSKVPFIAMYVVSNVTIFSLIAHKEERFLSSVVALGGLFFALPWLLFL